MFLGPPPSPLTPPRKTTYTGLQLQEGWGGTVLQGPPFPSSQGGRRFSREAEHPPAPDDALVFRQAGLRKERWCLRFIVISIIGDRNHTFGRDEIPCLGGFGSSFGGGGLRKRVVFFRQARRPGSSVDRHRC